MRDCYYERDTGIDDLKRWDSGNKKGGQKKLHKD